MLALLMLLANVGARSNAACTGNDCSWSYNFSTGNLNDDDAGAVVNVALNSNVQTKANVRGHVYVTLHVSASSAVLNVNITDNAYVDFNVRDNVHVTVEVIVHVPGHVILQVDARVKANATDIYHMNT